MTPDEDGWEKLCELRENKQVMKWIVEKAIVYVVSKRIYNKMIGTKILSDWCNVGDEAMAMTMLENSWDYWCDKYARKGGEAGEGQVVHRKWSVWREKKNGTERKQNRWDPNGTTAYYKWREKVIESRSKRGKDFDKWLLGGMRKVVKVRKGKAGNLSSDWMEDTKEVKEEDDFSDGSSVIGFVERVEL